MRLTQDDEMVHTLAPDRSDQPFGKAILPRRGWRGRLVPDAHGAQSACDDGAIDTIPIANEVLRRLIPRKCLRYLVRNPFCCGTCRDVGPDQVSAVQTDDDEGIEQVEPNRRDNEQIHGGNVRRMVAQKDAPSIIGAIKNLLFISIVYTTLPVLPGPLLTQIAVKLRLRQPVLGLVRDVCPHSSSRQNRKCRAGGFQARSGKKRR